MRPEPGWDEIAAITVEIKGDRIDLWWTACRTYPNGAPIADMDATQALAIAVNLTRAATGIAP